MCATSAPIHGPEQAIMHGGSLLFLETLLEIIHYKNITLFCLYCVCEGFSFPKEVMLVIKHLTGGLKYFIGKKDSLSREFYLFVQPTEASWFY